MTKRPRKTTRSMDGKRSRRAARAGSAPAVERIDFAGGRFKVT
jgi:hypothetical protein